MKSMYIGSGDVHALLMGRNTDGHQKLLRRFVSGEKPRYNAKASPIDALRVGAILEERYFLTLGENFYSQYVVTSKEMNVLKCSLDFAELKDGEVINFEELKTCNFNDFLLFEQFRNNYDGAINYIKKYYKSNYNQIQEQLYCTELQSAYLVFLAVYSYDDEENYIREIKANEYIKFLIFRDEVVISEIKERANIFQTLKDYYEMA